MYRHSEGEEDRVTLTFRIALIVVSVANLFWSVRQINKVRIKVEDTAFWIVFSLLLAIISIFPGIPICFSELLGIMSPANLVFLLIIFALIVKLFLLELDVSKLESKMQTLAQNEALLEKKLEESDKEER